MGPPLKLEADVLMMSTFGMFTRSGFCAEAAAPHTRSVPVQPTVARLQARQATFFCEMLSVTVW